MKNIRTSLIVVRGLIAVLCASALTAQANPLQPNKVQYSADQTMTATGVEADATGRVQVFLKQQGSSDHQRLRLLVGGLDPHTPYTLQAQMGDDSNFVSISTLTTTPAGSGNVLFLQNGVPKTVRKKKHALPELLDSLTEVRALIVANTNGEAVLTVNLHESESMRFELSSVFSNTGNDADAIGCLAVSSQSGHVQFRLFAAGQSSAFSFWVNDQSVATYSTDTAGRISIGAFPTHAPSPLLFRKLRVSNAAHEVVLQTDLR